MRKIKNFVKIIIVSSIRMSIIAPVVSFFIIGTLIISFIVISGTRMAIDNSLSQLSKASESLVTKEISSQLNKALQLNQLHDKTYSRDLIDFSNQAERERYFTSAIQTLPGAVMTFIAFPDGQFYGARRNPDGSIHVVRNNESTGGHSMYYQTNELGEGTIHFEIFKNFDARKRPWYKAAADKGYLTFSPIYSHFIFKEPTVTASLPIYQNGELVAVFGVDYLMTWLGQTLGQLPIGENGHVVIINQNNQLIASTTGAPEFRVEEGRSVNVLLEESTHPIMQAIFTEMKQIKENEFISTSIADKPHYIGLIHYKEHGLDLRIYTVLARGDFLKEVNLALYQTIFLAVLFSLFFMFFIFFITKLLVKPILSLNDAAKKLFAGVFEETPVSGRKDELGELINSFNTMGRQLTMLLGDLETQVAERTQELAQKNAQLNVLTYIDALTGIANRRRFDEFAKQAAAIASRNQRPFVLMLLDIDWFKPFNDTYGHIAGDQCIEQIGHSLRSVIKRQIDLCARYGGEEFAVILQESDYENALKIAEEIRETIFDLEIPHSGSKYGRVTLSIGLFYGTIGIYDQLEQLVNLADQALYEAKEKGRNNVQVAKQKL